MTCFDLAALDDQKLKTHHEMMEECVFKVGTFSSLATSLWQEVLKELEKRKLVELVSGSFDDVGNAHFRKLW